MKTMKKANIIAQSVKDMLDNPFNILANVQATDYNLIDVKIIDGNAEYVKQLMAYNYCESLLFVKEHSEDGVTTLTYTCYPFLSI